MFKGSKNYQDHLGEGWASFMYERLPNICYWCGLVLHNDKDCILWLNNRGSLRIKEQQFGPWIRAPQFNHVRKSIVEVQGYDQPRRTKPQSVLSKEVQTGQTMMDIRERVDITNLSVEKSTSKTRTAVPREVNGGGVECKVGGRVHEKDVWESLKHIPDFEETLNDIDDIIRNGPRIPNSKVAATEITANQAHYHWS